MNSLETKNVRRDYIVPDCQVHRFSYEVMTDIVNGSGHDGPGGSEVDIPGRPSLGGAKEYHPWTDIWDDENLLEDE